MWLVVYCIPKLENGDLLLSNQMAVILGMCTLNDANQKNKLPQASTNVSSRKST